MRKNTIVQKIHRYSVVIDCGIRVVEEFVGFTTDSREEPETYYNGKSQYKQEHHSWSTQLMLPDRKHWSVVSGHGSPFYHFRATRIRDCPTGGRRTASSLLAMGTILSYKDNWFAGRMVLLSTLPFKYHPIVPRRLK